MTKNLLGTSTSILVILHGKYELQILLVFFCFNSEKPRRQDI